MKQVTSEDFLKIKFPHSPVISRDGSKVVFVIKEVNEKNNQYNSHLFLNMTGETKYIQFTSGNHIDTSPKFSPCGKYMGFLSTREEEKLQVYIIPIDGGEALRVTNFPNGVLDFNWSHNSDFILVQARVNQQELDNLTNMNEEALPSYVLQPVEYKIQRAKKEELKELDIDPRVIKDGYYREGTNYLDNRYTQPFIVPIENFNKGDQTRNFNKLIHIGEFGYHYNLGVFSLDNSFIYLSKCIGDPSVTKYQEILKIDINDPSKKTYLGTIFGDATNFNLSPDGSFISFEAIREEKIVYDNSQIFLVKTNEEKKYDFQCITENYDRSSIQSIWTNNEELLFLSPKNGRINIYSININTKKVKLIVGGNRNINSYSFSVEGKSIVFDVSHSSFPGDIFWCKQDGSEEKRITEVNRDYIANHNILKVNEFTYTREGYELQGWILLPTNHNLKDTLPVVLEVHGGPSVMWSPHEKTMWHEFNTIVSKGFAVVFCNPRGSDGYGINFRSLVFKNWGDSPSNDILEGLDVALDKFPFLDKERIFVTGGSYGGYMTTWLIGHSNRFKAAVTQRGVYDFISFGLTTDIPIWFEKQYDGEILDRFATIWQDQPMAHIKKIQTPLLIIHSENDFRVPIVTAEQLFWLCKRYGKVVEFIRYPRDGHELSRSGEPRHIIDRINRICNWFKKYDSK